ncbi:MAG: phenylalanine--tRNA ligase subunit alpha [Planctomycetota bacterium]|nr:phenylalanine--tRNA ligase subunit alpha [Planctomycetota bacterium]MDW8372982.1 phenylalanine--tRNA ligase subunit alpha [Planctomycetota bacterium]
MDDFAARCAAAAAEAQAAFAAAADAETVERLRIQYLGRNGIESALAAAFAAASPSEKKQFGPAYNHARQAMRQAWEQARQRVSTQAAEEPIDVTLPPRWRRTGSIHPLSRLADDIEAVFTAMGYECVEGPHVELDEYNFGRLNIPADHPARDHQDSLWLADGLRLLRTHTSSVQARVYAEVGEGRRRPPFRCVAIGRVFRNDAIDATHDVSFTQVEGFVVDRDITVAHLVGVLRTMLSAVLDRDDVEIRLRPSYFPFVEPGFEVDVRLLREPPASRLSRWMELLGCGLIHPRVLAAGAAELAEWSGFAFGMGLERLAMLRHHITDIRIFHGGDLRSLRQFA